MNVRICVILKTVGTRGAQGIAIFFVDVFVALNNIIVSFLLSPGRSPVSFDSEIIMMNHVYKERFPKVRIYFKGENNIQGWLPIANPVGRLQNERSSAEVSKKITIFKGI